MSNSLQSLIRCGSKLWLDSIDPELVRQNFQVGATGATSNPIIVADLIKSGRFDDLLQELSLRRRDDSQIAWEMTDYLVSRAQEVFLPVWEQTGGNDGYVSFEIDPLLEDAPLTDAQRARRYVELGKQWSAQHRNRLIKVPGTDAGIAALADLAAEGVPLNVTLIFSQRQYRAARDAIWRGMQQLGARPPAKSVYSIFVSRIDVYTQKHVPQLGEAAQGNVGIVNAKRIWADNRQFWLDKPVELSQEIVFASTGTKDPRDPPWKYVLELAGSDIQTNPPATNDEVEASGLTFQRRVDVLPDSMLLDEIDRQVDFDHLEQTLMREGIAKFAEPQRALLELISSRRRQLANA